MAFKKQTVLLKIRICGHELVFCKFALYGHKISILVAFYGTNSFVWA